MYYRIWCSALVVLTVVVWSWDVSCVHCEGEGASEMFLFQILNPHEVTRDLGDKDCRHFNDRVSEAITWRTENALALSARAV